eukprot:Cvel_3276.t1-p1 / transcript=Cvel_3276.t1 / gene=Cvel_3276 / organism=Chromera_velia_CCMP2878 / gene_product=hypothetical protein / transcript_product=hypothetical protein / location=Cvel_scaffold129:343-5062(-) / protein_length=1168 / sequence_SO=supercontig / SO=protein_coding / is_pseudo=false
MRVVHLSSGSPASPPDAARKKFFSVLANSGCLGNKVFWKLTSLSRLLLSIRVDAELLRRALHSNTLKQREELSAIAITTVIQDDDEQLEALLSSNRFGPHWRLSRDEKGKVLPHDTDLLQIATQHNSLDCLKALISHRPLLPPPSRAFQLPLRSGPAVLASMKILLEAQQLDPNGTIDGVPWILFALHEGRHREALLLIQKGARVDVWDPTNPISHRRERNGERGPSGQSPLHVVLEGMENLRGSTPSHCQELVSSVVEGARERGCLDWVAWDSARKNEGTALVLAAHRVSKKTTLCSRDLGVMKKMIEAGADVRATDQGKLSSLHLVCKAAGATEYTSGNVTHVPARTAESAMRTDIPHIPLIDSLLKCDPSLINFGPRVKKGGGTGRYRYTPAMASAELGLWGLVGALIDRGADTNMGRTLTPPFATLLHLALVDGWKGPAAALPLLTEILSRAGDVNVPAEFSGGMSGMMSFLPRVERRKVVKLRLSPIAFALTHSSYHQKPMDTEDHQILQNRSARIKLVSNWPGVDLSNVASCVVEEEEKRENRISKRVRWEAARRSPSRSPRGASARRSPSRSSDVFGDEARSTATLSPPDSNPNSPGSKNKQLSPNPERSKPWISFSAPEKTPVLNEQTFNALEWATLQGDIASASWLQRTFPHLTMHPETVIKGDPSGTSTESLELFDISAKAAGLLDTDSDRGKKSETLKEMALQCARLNASPFLTKLLTHWGFAPEDLDVEGEGTPLHVAAKRGSLFLVRSLVGEGGWDPNIVSESLDAATPLMVAGTETAGVDFASSASGIITALVNAGADLFRKDKNGKTALGRAMEEGDKDRIAALVRENMSASAGREGREEIGAVVSAALKVDSRTEVEQIFSLGGQPLVRSLIDTVLPQLVEAVRGCDERRKWFGRLLLGQCGDRGAVEHTESRWRVVVGLSRTSDLAGMLKKSLGKVMLEVKEKIPWESGCINCDFIFESSPGPDPSGVPDWNLHRLLQRVEETASFGRAQEGLFEELDRIVEEEERKWDTKIKMEMEKCEGDDLADNGTVREVATSLSSKAEKIKAAHVSATRWCMERVKVLIRAFCLETADSQTPFDVPFSAEPHSFPDNPTDKEKDKDKDKQTEKEKDRVGTPPATSPLCKVRYPNAKAMLNVQLFQIVKQLFAKAKNA